MPATYAILFTKRAATDLDAIFSYISRQSPASAAPFIRKLVDAIDSLAIFPRRYRLIYPHLRTRRGTRMMVVWPYLIYYRILEDQRAVRIITVRHGARRRPKNL